MEKSLSLYLHIPFCQKKCAYCDFLSAPADEQSKEVYTNILLKEIVSKSTAYKSYSVPSVFIGGGTPSILTGVQISKIMQALADNFKIETGAELTIECNPGTVTEQKLKIYMENGINRISFGLQSADDRELRLLGRIHSFRQFLDNYELARRIGFQNINLDLMYGLPGQTLDTWTNTLDQVLRLHPEHISAYGLILEEGTPFYNNYEQDLKLRQEGGRPLHLPEEETELHMYETARQLMAENGYDQYEISNYAKANKKCRHNIRYWQRQNYLGLGLGSASLVEECRFCNTDQIEQYPDKYLNAYQIQNLTKKEQMEEYLFLGLRMRTGISKKLFQDTFAVDLCQIYGNQIQELCNQQLLEQIKGWLRLTDDGVYVSNFVLAHFIL